MPRGVFKRRKETLEKLSFSLRKAFAEGRKKSAIRRGQKLSEDHKRKIGTSNLGKKHTEDTKNRISETRKSRKYFCNLTGAIPWNKGKKMSPEHREKISRTQKGEKSHFWKGGITPINLTIRQSLEYKLWREAVFGRDNYTCIWCGSNKSGTLNADHIKPFAHYPELRFAIDNGRTLCVPCHRKTDTYGYRSKLKD